MFLKSSASSTTNDDDLSDYSEAPGSSTTYTKIRVESSLTNNCLEKSLSGDAFRESVENEYKERLTRYLNEDEIKSKIKENLFESYIKQEFGNHNKNKHSAKSSRTSDHHVSVHSVSNSYCSSNSSSCSSSSMAHRPHSTAFKKSFNVLPNLNRMSAPATNRPGNNSASRLTQRPRPNSQTANVNQAPKSSYSAEDRRKYIHSAPTGRATGTRVKFIVESGQNVAEQVVVEPLPVEPRRATPRNSITADSSSLSPRKTSSSSLELNANMEKKSLKDLSPAEREQVFLSLRELKEKLKKIENEEHRHGLNRENSIIKSETKSILREQKPISAKSMSVDKWIEVHKRRNNRTANEFLNRNERIKLLNQKVKEQLNLKRMQSAMNREAEREPEVTEDEAPDYHESLAKLNSLKKLKYRSRRELSDLTVLDKIQNRIKLELEENLRNLRKLESQNEFNSVVAKIKNFLVDMDKSSKLQLQQQHLPLQQVPNQLKLAQNQIFTFSSLNKTKPFKLYEYEMIK